MAQGLELYNANGVKYFDGATLTGRVLGSLTVKTGDSGEITHTEFANGTPFFCAVNTTAGIPSSFLSVYVKGSKILYTYGADYYANSNIEVVIVYGVLP